MNTVKNRYDFVYLFDCQDGNPNGDPDSDNSPRVDPETFQGLVSDVCLKRKIRDYVYQRQQDGGNVKKGYDVFVLAGNTLESRQRMPFDHLKSEIKAQGKDTKADDIKKARDWMCQNFFDIRAFGAVMTTTEFNCGQVRGPVQLTFARSIDRVFTTEHTITRQDRPVRRARFDVTTRVVRLPAQLRSRRSPRPSTVRPRGSASERRCRQPAQILRLRSAIGRCFEAAGRRTLAYSFRYAGSGMMQFVRL